MRVMLLLFTFYLNGGLHAVSIGKCLNGCQIFGWFGFLKTKFELNFGFSRIANGQLLPACGYCFTARHVEGLSVCPTKWSDLL